MSPLTARGWRRSRGSPSASARRAPTRSPLRSPISPGSCPRARSESAGRPCVSLPAPAASPTLELLEVHAAVSRIAAISGPGSQARAPRRAGGSLRPSDQRGAAVPDGPAPGGAQAGRARGRHGRGGSEGRRRSRRGGPARGHGRGRARAGRLGRADRGPGGPRPVPAHRAAPGSADARADRRRSRDAFARIRPARIEWKLDGARLQVHRLGRRDPRVHAEPRRHHRPCARDRRGCRSARGRGDRPRRRGDRRWGRTSGRVPSRRR